MQSEACVSKALALASNAIEATDSRIRALAQHVGSLPVS